MIIGLRPGAAMRAIGEVDYENTKGKDGPVTVKVPKGTQITNGNDHMFLPGVKGRQITIADVNDNGARVAKSLEMKAPQP